jgi:RHS repeat-associated protein
VGSAWTHHATAATKVNFLASSHSGRGLNAYHYYYHNDHLGTPQFVTDEAGNVVWRGELEPYGKLMSEDRFPDGDTPTFNQPIRFPGQIALSRNECGICYNKYRHYISDYGVYGQLDPNYFGLLGGTWAFPLIRYAYASYNPIGKLDPDGFADVYIYEDGRWWAFDHAAMRLENGTYIGLDKGAAGSDSAKSDLMSNGGGPVYAFHFDGLDEMAIQNWWDNYKKFVGYSALLNNCTDVVEAALRVGGFEGVGGLWDFIKTPQQLRDRLNEYLDERLIDKGCLLGR